jgi:hypothetical protein
MASVDIDIDYYLDEASETALIQEINRRRMRKGKALFTEEAPPMTYNETQAMQACNEISDYLRAQGLINWANTIDMIRDDYIVRI